MAGHPHIDRWSLMMHRHIADRIEAGDESPLQIATGNLARWKERNGGLVRSQEEWVAILQWPTSRLLEMLRSDDEEATRLRSSSPFAGAIDQRLRIELLREARAA
jgi:hypothetical protein